MLPLYDENPTVRTPIVTIVLLLILGAVWLLVQGAGFDELALVTSVCNYGAVAGELTGRAPVGQAVPLAPGLACVVDREPINWLTPVTSMFLHGAWMHLLGNGLFLWIFGNNVEDSTGRGRFVIFYLLCGLAAAATQIAVDPASPVPMVGASGAISGVLGAYLVLYPRARVHVLFIFIIFVQVIVIPAYLVLLWWIGLQVIAGLPQLGAAGDQVEGGVAFWAHIGGFMAGVVLIKPFVDRELVSARHAVERRRGFVGRRPRYW
jgi:membrane associated rhomboid family serine protease